jgi:hypothetical protein
MTRNIQFIDCAPSISDRPYPALVGKTPDEAYAIDIEREKLAA